MSATLPKPCALSRLPPRVVELASSYCTVCTSLLHYTPCLPSTSHHRRCQPPRVTRPFHLCITDPFRLSHPPRTRAPPVLPRVPVRVSAEHSRHKKGTIPHIRAPTLLLYLPILCSSTQGHKPTSKQTRRCSSKESYLLLYRPTTAFILASASTCRALFRLHREREQVHLCM
jgi:hypothetical protein